MKGLLACLLLSCVVASIAYLASSSMLLALLVLVSYFGVTVLLCLPRFRLLQRKRQARKDCFRFMNSFITTCSVTSSLIKSFEVACEGATGDMKEALSGTDGNKVEDRLSFLSPYFQSPLYEVFLSVVFIYQNRGGDILALSSALLEEAAKVEADGDKRLKGGASRMLKHGLLWVMSLGIVAFLRFALSSFYGQLLVSSTYLLSLGFYFVFLLFSLVFYCFRYTEEIGKTSLFSTKKGGWNEKKR